MIQYHIVFSSGCVYAHTRVSGLRWKAVQTWGLVRENLLEAYVVNNKN